MKMKPFSLPPGREDLSCGGYKRRHFFPLAVPVSCHPPQILIPALMVTAEKDFVLTPDMSRDMEDWVRMVLPWGQRCFWEGAGVPERRRQLRAEWHLRMNHLLDQGLHPEHRYHLLGARVLTDASFSLC